MSQEVAVLIGFAEALAAPEVVWSLVDRGYKVIAFARRGRRSALRSSRHVSIREITAPEDDCAGALRDLSDLLEAINREARCRDVLLPLDDSAVWLCDRIPRSAGWLLAGARGRCAELALDKYRQLQDATAAGFYVPAAIVVNRVDELLGSARRFPLILRSANAVAVHEGRLRRGRNWICADDVELRSAALAWSGAGPLLVQPYLEGVGEGVFGLATENGVVAWSAHRRLRMMNPHGSGSSACISQAIPTSVEVPVSNLVGSAGWRGMFMVELLRTQDGALWFIEFNGRAWGSMALSRRQLLEYPAWTVELALDSRASPSEGDASVQGMVCRHLGRELMHLLFVVRGSRSRGIRKWPSFWSTLVDVFTNHPKSSFYNWRKDDWRVFVYDSWYTIRDQIIKSH